MGHPNAEARERRNKAVLVIVKNDPEAEVTVRLAEDTMSMVVLDDNGHGTTLDDYPGVLARIRRVRNCTEVWTFELPGPKTEAAIVAAGYTLHTIDHHAYGFDKATGKPVIDRTRDAEGNLRPSALAQFIELGGYTDDEIKHLVGHDPKVVHGIGIYDASVGWGLRAAGYGPYDIGVVLEFRARIMRKTTKNFDRVMQKAREFWANRERRDWYWLIMAGGSAAPATVHAAVEDATAHGHEEDAEPMVIAAPDGLVITVRHVSEAVVTHLQAQLGGNVFGTHNCWVADNRHGHHAHVTLEQVIAVLETAPR